MITSINNNMAGRDRGKSAESKKKEVEEEIEDEEPPEIQWSFLTLEQISLLRELTVDEVQLQFVDLLQFKNQQTCLKEAALLDYFVSGFWWTKEQNFTSEQTSFVMAVLQSSIDNISEKQMTFVDNFTEFGTTLINLRKTPTAEGDPPLFDIQQAKAITDYVTYRECWMECLDLNPQLPKKSSSSKAVFTVFALHASLPNLF